MASEAWDWKRHPRCKFSITEEVEMIKRYLSGETFSDMAPEMSTNRTRLWEIATKEYDVETYQNSGYPKNYSLDPETFSSITERSTYALGLIASDGHINTNKALVFASEDKEQLDNLKDCLHCTKDTKVIPKGKYSNKSDMYKITLGNETLTRDICSFIPRRSKDLTGIPATIKESSLLHHYIRGFLDGDGSVDNGGRVVFTGKKNVMEDLAKTILEKYNIDYTSITPVSGSKSYHLNYTRKGDSKKLYNVLYNNAQHFLTRKKNRLDENFGSDK